MMVATAVSLFIGDEEIRRGIIGIWTVIFTAFYSVGIGPVAFTLSAEIFPLEYRMVGMSMVVALNLALGGVFNLVTPLVLHWSRSVLLGGFAVANIVAWMAVWVFVREPQASPRTGSSTSNEIRLEEIIEIYDQPRQKFVDFQRRNWQGSLGTVNDFLRGRSTPRPRPFFFADSLDETALQGQVNGR